MHSLLPTCNVHKCFAVLTLWLITIFFFSSDVCLYIFCGWCEQILNFNEKLRPSENIILYRFSKKKKQKTSDIDNNWVACITRNLAWVNNILSEKRLKFIVHCSSLLLSIHFHLSRTTVITQKRVKKSVAGFGIILSSN